MEKKHLWILTEERPKKVVIEAILARFARDRQFACFMNTLRILPVLENGRFCFLYEVTGFECNRVDKVYVKCVSGGSSFVDFLVFYQNEMPGKSDVPLYAVEETKTDDSESRNTGVGQRSAKFVYLDRYYPDTTMIMLYNIRVEPQKSPTATNVFGTRLLQTIGVDFIGKQLDPSIFRPFRSVDELVAFKRKMHSPPAGNVPIIITRHDSTITVSGRLIKSDALAHDPSIGQLSVISAALRKLGWDGRIVITRHGLEQRHLHSRNKFVRIANALGIEVDGLRLPKAIDKGEYWKYETGGEKLGTIFIHLVVESFTEGRAIFENHAGCEKGYFITKDGQHLQLEKYCDRESYKAGDKTQIVSIPDLILVDFGRTVVINVEGKQYRFREDGIRGLAKFDEIETRYIGRYYPEFDIVRTVVLYGGTETKVAEMEVGFLLNENGDLILGINAPKLFVEAIKNLVDFWS